MENEINKQTEQKRNLGLAPVFPAISKIISGPPQNWINDWYDNNPDKVINRVATKIFDEDGNVVINDEVICQQIVNDWENESKDVIDYYLKQNTINNKERKLRSLSKQIKKLEKETKEIEIQLKELKNGK